jgi:ATP-binding cassette subfamily F protein uup
MPLVSLRQVSYTWGGPLLLDHVSIEVERGERIGLVGRNGTGKSTLMSLFDGTNKPEDGEIYREPGVKFSRLVQDVPQDTSGQVLDIVRQGATHDKAISASAIEMDEWEIDHKAYRVIEELMLDPEAEFSKLSSGMKRRVLLARTLINEPDVLMLDEPTNHLDIESIAWLEKFLNNYRGTVIFVTHDRQFLQAVATRIIEVERARLFDWTCDYETFLQRKQAALESEERQNELFDKKLAVEEVWIRQGVKARRTRSIARVRALQDMREQRRQRRNQVGNVSLQVATAEQSGLLVIEATDISYSIPGRTLIDNFTTLITRGDKIGIIGTNGAGKSTLLKLLLQDLKPSSGNIRQGTNLQITYFDQLREQIDETKTIIENVSDGTQTIMINGVGKNIYSYLQDFLFTPDRARTLCKYLSGGERNRLLLAKLFTRTSNLMILDEPTNDLDTETLELLEEMLVNYTGTIIVVSHDRAFLNNVVTSTIALEGDGVVREYIGGFDDYQRQKAANDRAAKLGAKSPTTSASSPKSTTSTPSTALKVKKLSFKEQKELEELPLLIDKLESENEILQTAMANPAFFKRPADEMAKDMNRVKTVGEKLAKAYQRWEELGG